MGKYISTKTEYLKTMKQMGLEPYRGEISRPDKPAYKPSQWARDMVNAAQRGPVGDVWKREVATRGQFKPLPPELPAHYRKSQKGGIYQDGD